MGVQLCHQIRSLPNHAKCHEARQPLLCIEKRKVHTIGRVVLHGRKLLVFLPPSLSPDDSGDFGRIGEPRVELAKDEKRSTNFHVPSQRRTFV
jgi:hypothetical protein